MAMSGMLIPAAEGSQISVFDRVLADIGDTQSIEQNLSTFSAHMRSVINILEQADDRTLVLLDELVPAPIRWRVPPLRRLSSTG